MKEESVLTSTYSPILAVVKQSLPGMSVAVACMVPDLGARASIGRAFGTDSLFAR